MRYVLLILTVALSGCANGPSAQDVMQDRFAKQAAETDRFYKEAHERSVAQVAAMTAALKPLAACVKTQATTLAASPESADTLARVALTDCGPAHSDYTSTVRRARDLFNFDQAQADIERIDASLRDMALATIVDLRSRSRQTPQPTPPPPAPRRDAI